MTLIDGYLTGNRNRHAEGAGAGAGQRSEAFSALFDPTTFRHIERLGIGPGWRCWEVGAGGTSVVSWLAKRVGPTGRILATDTDISWQTSAARTPVEVRRHDVGADAPPAQGGFDLVHARLVLAGAPDQELALRSMIRALRPGGRLLIEESDPALQPLACPDECGPAEQLANRLRQALLTQYGTDLAYGRGLPRLLRAAGLRQVEADVYFPLASPACAALETATIQQSRAALTSAGLATDDDITAHLANIAAEPMDLATAPLISTWARKP
ncbi:methyltransferase domain-containing protein [Streptomyces sp. NPDC047525]|uniref:methyltransferase domain-containing protein n=1 Tax=Streptomyces sp. NPDC047525 TaxID=3155264 RepID=UPI0033C8C968